MLKNLKLLAIFAFALSLGSCKTSNNAQNTSMSTTATKEINNQGNSVPAPPLFVYKTRADYNDKVPILLSPEDKKITSYPDVKDVTLDGKLRLPTILEQGYLIDNKGISKDAAFIKLTYAEYAALKNTPDAKELESLIIDNEPFTELYQCKRYYPQAEQTEYFNNLIKNGLLSKECKRVK